MPEEERKVGEREIEREEKKTIVTDRRIARSMKK